MQSNNPSAPPEASVALEEVRATGQKLLTYCQKRNWAGWDPYDALNSKFFQTLPFLNVKLPRLVATQALKRSPINVRPLLMVPQSQNPKGIGLFLSALVQFSAVGKLESQNLIDFMIERLIALRSPDTAHWGWGYSFPWQTRTLLVPRWAPNLVCTTFVANALLDAYEHNGDAKLLEMAASSVEFIFDNLYWTEGPSVAGFAYPLPSMRNNVHNGNLLGAALVCRVAKLSGEEKFIEKALKVARFSVSRQQADGSWNYGESPAQKWIDNFHTGFNLCALRDLGRYLGTDEFEPSVRHGFEFYRDHFFLKDGTAKYYHDQTYPIDIHCVAQSVITLVSLKDLDSSNVLLAQQVFQWALNHMWDVDGFFYYRVLRAGTIHTSYMRWSQAWMLLAISQLLSALVSPGRNEHSVHSGTIC